VVRAAVLPSRKETPVLALLTLPLRWTGLDTSTATAADGFSFSGWGSTRWDQDRFGLVGGWIGGRLAVDWRYSSTVGWMDGWMDGCSDGRYGRHGTVLYSTVWE